MIRRIRDGISLLERVRLRVDLRKKGTKWWGCCPFHHEDTASFFVDDHGSFYCFGCQAHGDIIDWTQRTEGITKGKAIRKLADELGLAREPRYEKPPPPTIDALPGSVAQQDLPGVRVLLKVEFETLAARYQVCLQAITRLERKTVRPDMGGNEWEQLAERLHEKDTITAALIAFFDRKGLWSFDEFVWQMLGASVWDILGNGEVDGTTERALLRQWAYDNWQPRHEWKAHELRRTSGTGKGDWEWLAPHFAAGKIVIQNGALKWERLAA